MPKIAALSSKRAVDGTAKAAGPSCGAGARKSGPGGLGSKHYCRWSSIGGETGGTGSAVILRIDAVAGVGREEVSVGRVDDEAHPIPRTESRVRVVARQDDAGVGRDRDEGVRAE